MPAADRPIEEYAVIGNCETAALINADGGIDWLCLPAFDGPSFFGALLDREKGGEFTIRPSETYRVERKYLDDSALFETRFTTASGTVKLTDFFVIARKRGARGYDFTTLYPTRKLVRLIEHVSGAAVPMKMHLRARPNFARESAQRDPKSHGLADHEKFTRYVGRTIGMRAIVAGFARAPKTLRLLFRSGPSKWREPDEVFLGNNVRGAGLTPPHPTTASQPKMDTFSNDPTLRETSYVKAIVAGLAGGLVGTLLKTICEMISPPRPQGMESPLLKMLGLSQ